LVVVAVGTAGVIIFVTRATTSRLATALGFAPASADSADFTDWDALGHDPRSAPATAGSWAQNYFGQQSRIGVTFAETNWELKVHSPEGACDIFQWPNADGPQKLATALVKAGWSRSTDAGRTILRRGNQSDDSDWSWTFLLRTFGIDTASHRVAQCVSESSIDGALSGLGGRSFGESPDIQPMTGAEGEGVAVTLRHGGDICFEHQSPLAPTGPTSGFTAVGLALDGRDLMSGVVTLAYPTGEAADADLDARKAAFTRAQQHNKAQNIAKFELSSIEVDGPVIVAHIDSAAPLDLVEISGNLGLDDCNDNP
jgi:hypothetical protein